MNIQNINKSLKYVSLRLYTIFDVYHIVSETGQY